MCIFLTNIQLYSIIFFISVIFNCLLLTHNIHCVIINRSNYIKFLKINTYIIHIFYFKMYTPNSRIELQRGISLNEIYKYIDSLNLFFIAQIRIYTKISNFSISINNINKNDNVAQYFSYIILQQ